MEYVLLTIWALFCWLLVNCVHEGSHILIGYLGDGLKPTLFKPYPHMHEGRLYFARYEMIGRWPTGPGESIHIAPLISSTVCAGVGLIHFATYSEWIYAIFTACFLIDSFVWMYGYHFGKSHTDGYKYKHGI